MKHNVYLEFGKSRQGLVKNFKKSYPWLVAESNSATLEAFLRLEEIRLHRHLVHGDLWFGNAAVA